MAPAALARCALAHVSIEGSTSRALPEPEAIAHKETITA